MKRSLVGLAATTLVLLGVLTGCATEPTASSGGVGAASSGSQAESIPEIGSGAESGGDYIAWSETAIADATGTPLLFFHASWCPSCRAVEESIVADGIPEGFTVIKVDYDTHQDLRQKYGVTQQTSFVEVDALGEKVQLFLPSTDLTIGTIVDTFA